MGTENLPAAQREAPKPAIQMGERGLQLTSLEDTYRFAQCVAQSGLAPNGLKEATQIMIAIQMGAELGLAPMASIQNIAVINGRPSLWGDAALAICQADPRYLDIEEYFDADGTAVCEVKVRGREKPVVRRFAPADAKTAGLSGKAGPWQQYPKRMLQMRARAWAIRDALPGALKGLYLAEEAQDIPRQADGVEVTTISKLDTLLGTDTPPDATPEAPATVQSYDPGPEYIGIPNDPYVAPEDRGDAWEPSDDDAPPADMFSPEPPPRGKGRK